MTAPDDGTRHARHARHPGTPGPQEELEFSTHLGDTIRFAVRYGADRRAPGRPGVLVREVTLSAGWPVLQYRLPRSAQADPHAYGALEREVSAAVALERRYGTEKFGEVFTRVVGFDLEGAEPFVLYRLPAGSPLTECAGRLNGDEQHRVLAQLALAVRLLAEVEFVHRTIAPDTVRWDGTHVRLGEPYAVLREGEPREAFGSAPWASPEQRAGRGTADTRDDLWSVGRIGYYLLSGHPDRGEGPPEDLGDYRRLAALEHSGLFAADAAGRPSPVELLRLLHVPDPLATAVGAPDPLSRGRAEFDAHLARKRRVAASLFPPEPSGTGDGRQPGGDAARNPYDLVPPRPSLRARLFGGDSADRNPPRPAPAPPPPPASATADVPAARRRGRMCPHCLLSVEYDESLLVTIDAKGNRLPLDLAAEQRPAHRRELLRKAYHLCPHAGPGDEAHELPVPYLTNGEPLSIAFVGSSSVGKTHLLAAMLGEVELGGLERYGLKCLPLNPDTHRAFLRERVQSLQQGRRLGSTVQQTFARFADGLLVSARGATPRPVVFFDLAGEDLAQDGAVTNFLSGVDAFVFVLDPLRALRMPALDPVREQDGLPLRDLGDEAFTTVLNRLERPADGLIGAPAAIAVNKSDLVRFEPAVDRWLGRALPPRIDREALRAESRDAYAFLAHHASRAWLKPFDDSARCTLHFVAATGGQAKGDRFPHGARSRRVLAPLLSIFAMCGLLPGAEPIEEGAG
ncbi:hypothetical protein [Streptomyces sp. NPDC001927]